MEQLYDLDGNRNVRNTNINHFAPLFESVYKEGTKPRIKTKKIAITVLTEYEHKDKNEW